MHRRQALTSEAVVQAFPGVLRDMFRVYGFRGSGLRFLGASGG